MYSHNSANDIKSPRLLYAKGVAFLAVGVLASVLLLLETPRVSVFLLHTIAIWAFARAYYFAFYVIEHYVDPSFRFSGLLAFIKHLGATKAEDRNSIGSSKQD